MKRNLNLDEGFSDAGLTNLNIDLLKDRKFLSVVSKHPKIAEEDLKFIELMSSCSIQNEEVVSDNNYGDLETVQA